MLTPPKPYGIVRGVHLYETPMKTDIHPTVYKATVVCACGNTFETLSTKETIQTEICSACHPYLTGKQKLVDTARRVEKLQEKQKKQAELAASRKHISKTAKRAAKSNKTKEAKSSAKAALKAAKAALTQE